MKYFCVLLFLCVCSPSLASEPIAFPVKYPESVKKMTDAEFFRWATNRNQKASDKWQDENAKQSPKYLTTPIVITEHQSRVRGNRRHSGGSVRGIQYSRVYNQQTLNPAYSSPGPLTIVNPYCKPIKAVK